jgi:UDP:flavonoid glycosyltransferase YjiC (YdhE family)
VERVPQLEILQRARVFVTHGGASSLREAIYFGVPTIVLPGWLDQFGNGARVVHHGLGLRADMATITPEQMSALLDDIMDERFLQANAQMRRHFREQESCQAGADFVESFLLSHTAKEA